MWRGHLLNNQSIVANLPLIEKLCKLVVKPLIETENASIELESITSGTVFKYHRSRDHDTLLSDTSYIAQKRTKFSGKLLE